MQNNKQTRGLLSSNPFWYMSDLINEIREKLNLESITAQCLIESGLTCIEECQDFLNPSLDKLSKIEDYEGFSQVKDRIKQAIENNETVVIS